MIKYSDITEFLPEDKDTPWLDRRLVRSPDDKELTPEQFQWMTEGVVTLKKFLPEELMNAYTYARQKHLGGGPMEKTGWYKGGWTDPTPYLRVPEMKDIALYKPLMDIMKSLLGDDMGLHLCLTGYTSTERRWHQDDYLNPPFVKSRYAAVWMALEDVSPDAGPFQYVPGSHNWPTIRREKVWNNMSPEEAASPGWPTISQDWVADACAEEIAKRGVGVVSYIPKRGDVLIWHGKLVHQGSKANNKELERRALIAHYSTLTARIDMPHRKQHPNGSWYFDFPDHQH